MQPATLMAEVRPRTPTFISLQNQLRDAKLAYAGAIPSKFRRTRDDLGGTGDAHYRNGLGFWQLREYARDMDRNDAVFGQLVDRALDNILGTGLRPDPDTGDIGLDQDQQDRFEEWATDEAMCDYSQRKDFSSLERLALRHRFVDGDCVVIPHQEGKNLRLQLLEGDRLPETVDIFKDIIHGVKVNFQTDQIESYYFTVPVAGRRQLGGRRIPAIVGTPETREVAARDQNGRLQVLHLLDPQRITQTRGVTAFRAVFDVLGMFEDVQFAKLVQQQVVSMIAVFIESERNMPWGNRTTDTSGRTDGGTSTFDELSPGLTVRLKPGEKMNGFSPNVPNPEFFPHVRLILRLIGCSIGMPLELVLLDTSDTTFHGYRGALQQAQKSFVRQQRLHPRQLHRHVWKRLIDIWYPHGSTVRKNKRLYRCSWRGEGWPYVDPRFDAQADMMRLSSGIASPRRVQAERGYDWDDVKREITEDWGSAILGAAEKAKEINDKFPDAFVTWRDCLNLSMGKAPMTGGPGAIAAEGHYLGGQARDPGGHFTPSARKDSSGG